MSIEFLRQVSLFASLPDAMLSDIAQAAEPVSVAAGEVLAQAGAMGQGVWIVVEGSVTSSLSGQGEHNLGVLQAGAVVDETLLLVGGAHTATFTAQTPAQLLRLDVGAFNELSRRDPQTWSKLATQRMLESVLASVAGPVFGAAAPEVLALAAAGGRWRWLAKGEVLVRQGDAAQDWFVVLSGELAMLKSAFGERRIEGFLRRGDVAGDLAHIAKSAHPVHLVASRDTWLVRLSPAEFGRLMLERGDSQAGLVRSLVRHVTGTGVTHAPSLGMRIAVLPLACQGGFGAGVNVMQFVDALELALARFGPVLVLDAALCELLNIVHDPHDLAQDHVEWMRLSGWLERQGQAGVRVILVGELAAGNWEQRISRDCDLVLHVGAGAGAPLNAAPLNGASPPSAVPEDSAWWRSPRWLCLLHAEDAVRPSGTAAWLDSVLVAAHFHVRTGRLGDIQRLARHISGNAVGLALSGGGARGPAHVGVYRALTQAGVPVDFISGASAGSLIGCLLSGDEGAEVVAQRAVNGIGSSSGLFGDYTLPVVSLIKTQRLKKAVVDTFGSDRLEDSWIPCAVVTTNLSRSKREVFRRGPIWQIALASSSPPAVTMPSVINGELHCDGGLVDNLPVDLLKDNGCRFTVASFVGSTLSRQLPNGEFPSSWGIVVDRLFRGGRNTRGVPTLVELLVAATTLASDAALPRIEAEVDLFFRPDLNRFSVLSFAQTPAVIEAGFQHAELALAQSRASGASGALWALVAHAALAGPQAAREALAVWSKARQISAL